MATFRRVLGLAIIMGAAVAEAQEPSGYWLYVDGAWKGGFAHRAACDAAGTKEGKSYECRPVRFVPRTPMTPDGRWAADVADCSNLTGVDAYVPGPGRVEYLGKPRGRFEFTKCLTERGHQLR